MATLNQTQENKAVVRSISEAISVGNLSAIDDLVTEDYVEHNPAFPSNRRGPASLKAFVEPFLAAFPDFELVEDDLIAEEDMVVYRHHATGTHEGKFMGFPPTGNRINVEGIAIYRIENGRAAEKWTAVDRVGLMRQLGIFPDSPRKFLSLVLGKLKGRLSGQ